MTLSDGAWLDEIYPIYAEIQSLKDELESSLTIEQVRNEYSKLIAEEDSKLDSLTVQKRKLEVEIRLPNTVRQNPIPIKPLPKQPDKKSLQKLPSTSTVTPTDKEKSERKKSGTEARDKLKKLVNRFYRFKLDASVLGQINRIADDVDRPLGEALALLDWSIFENYACTSAGDSSKLNLLNEWAKELQEYCSYLSGEVDLQKFRYRDYLGIWELWRNREKSPEHLQEWQTFIAETKQAKQDAIAKLKQEILELEAKIAQLKAARTQAGEVL
ncbi:hypothetical protein F7734_26820 [Scytonema sp. UIC 10036]|uniref:hypothetical protein n=1 Tax=Scytonema sp. UIC 10036 TaxID=2304196 RepID=UPI0012DAC43F|nr:hypothetical protein [Scytonema sp. UIC 10036]MUG95773.1 hypothetical protein [Scytonema sp. UIC 10036]